MGLVVFTCVVALEIPAPTAALLYAHVHGGTKSRPPLND